MKTTILIVLTIAAIALFYACDQKKAVDTTKAENKEPVTEPIKGDVPPHTESTHQLVGFRKTACFGKCPVYEVKFWSDNTATYVGKMHVERKGEYKAQLDRSTLKAIKDKAHEVGYFDFHNEYPVEHKVADLPSTYTYIRIGDMEKTIKNTHDGPKKLEEFQNYLSDIIGNLDWKPTAQD